MLDSQAGEQIKTNTKSMDEVCEDIDLGLQVTSDALDIVSETEDCLDWLDSLDGVDGDGLPIVAVIGLIVGIPLLVVGFVVGLVKLVNKFKKKG